FGRALGETMALAMLIGNSNQITLSLFAPANTLAALLALNFPEAGPREVEVLMYAALVLLALTLVVNLLGELIMTRSSRGLATRCRPTSVSLTPPCGSSDRPLSAGHCGVCSSPRRRGSPRSSRRYRSCPCCTC